MTIRRVEHLDSQTFLAEHFVPGVPVIIGDAMQDWPACNRWSLDYFADTLGDTVLRVMYLPKKRSHESRGRRLQERFSEVQALKMTLREYVEKLRTDEAAEYYIPGTPMGHDLRELHADLRPPIYAAPNAQPRLWLGSQVKGPLHYDPVNTLHGVVFGLKQWTLARPQETSKLYPMSPLSSTPHMSEACLRDPDLSRFPRLSEVDVLTANVGPGELLFVPVGWWHQVTTPVPTASVDFPFPKRRGLNRQLIRLVPSELTSSLRGLRRRVQSRLSS